MSSSPSSASVFDDDDDDDDAFLCKNAPTYACPRFRMSSSSAMSLASVTFTGMIIPGMSGLRGRGTANTCGCELGCPAPTMMPPVTVDDDAFDPPSLASPPSASPESARRATRKPNAEDEDEAPSTSVARLAAVPSARSRRPEEHLRPSRSNPPSTAAPAPFGIIFPTDRPTDRPEKKRRRTSSRRNRNQSINQSIHPSRPLAGRRTDEERGDEPRDLEPTGRRSSRSPARDGRTNGRTRESVRVAF